MSDVSPPEGGIGVGIQTGPLRLDYGADWATLTCNYCSASWLGQIGEPCPWCTRRLERTIIEQQQLLLHPELPDPDDQRYPHAVKAWGQRLARAAKAGIITTSQARHTYNHHRNRHHH